MSDASSEVIPVLTGTESVTPPVVALAGNPNCGKTALFNALTKGRQKVGNYPGVTVERKEGAARTPGGTRVSILDLPGAYSLDARTPDEAVTRDVILGLLQKETVPDLLVAVADATNLERCLGLVLEVKELNRPVILALNMMDLARERGSEIDLDILASELGVAVVGTVATRREGVQELLGAVESLLPGLTPQRQTRWRKPTAEEIHLRFQRVDEILRKAVKRPPNPTVWTDRLDRFVLHPVWGTLFLGAILAVLFQAIFTWASAPMDAIEAGISFLGDTVQGSMSEGPLRSLLVEGIITGVGSILVFLPQILLLFFFILLLEDSGYMARAAFLMDRLMGRVGLHGRAFIPLLSSFACAIPGIMASRTIENRRDRLTTILVAPLVTCSARLPVYSLLIAAFIPNTAVWGPLRLQGLVMFALYVGGIAAALLVAFLLRKTLFRGPKPPLIMELPTYKWPSLRGIALGLWQRAALFVHRAGTVILALSVLIWFLSSYPKAPEDTAGMAPISYSYAGTIGRAIEPLVAPIGFNWQIAVALIPGFAAREVMVGALATVYAVGAADDESTRDLLGAQLVQNWSLATALSLLVWYVLACQCLSTLAVTKRETNSWRWPAFMLLYMTVFAYGASYLTYTLARMWGG